MRSIVPALLAGILLTASAHAQPKTAVPEVPALPKSPKQPKTAPPAKDTSSTPPPPTADAFGSELPGGIEVSPAVRPPMPVDGPPEEIPPGPRFWLDFDYLSWRSKGGLAPALVGVAFGSPSQTSPVNPQSAFMANDNRMNGTMQNGFQFTAGHWLDKPDGNGVELRYQGFLNNENTATYFGTQRTFLNRPFWNEATNSPALFLLSTPSGSSVGSASVNTTFDTYGFEGNYLRRGPAMFSEEFHWLFGLRFWSLEEELNVEGRSRTAGMNVTTLDSFTTRNQFFGGQLGGKWRWTRNKLLIDVSWRMAVGLMMEDVNISGASTATLPSGMRIEAPGGFLALSTNSGDYSRAQLAWLRETQIGLSYAVHENVVLRLGWSFMYVSGVVRPGEQVDLGINPNWLPFSPGNGSLPVKPGFRFNQEDFFMYGLNFGVTVQF